MISLISVLLDAALSSRLPNSGNIWLRATCWPSYTSTRITRPTLVALSVSSPALGTKLPATVAWRV